MIIKIIVEVNRGVSLTEGQMAKLREATHGLISLGKKSATRKLVMCLIDHSLVNKLLTFLTDNGFDPTLRKANKKNGMRLGFNKDENGNIVRDTSEVPANELLADHDISAAFPQVQRTDHEGNLIVKPVRDANGEVVMVQDGVDGEGQPVMVVQTEADMMDVLPETFMGWA